MGLNLDIKHVAFSGLRKFDGRRMRDLMPHELAQIAGRAGRHTNAGTFGVTGRGAAARPGRGRGDHGASLRPGEAAAMAQLRTSNSARSRLIASLEERTEDEWLTRGRGRPTT
jgi:ATP-dependent RNA helicase SUPV3L1/SUV3